MNRKTQDSTDELLRALRATLDEDGDISPDDVFSDPSSKTRGTQEDEELAAFDSYMAALLDGVVADKVPPTAPSPKAKAKKIKKHTAKRSKEPAQPREDAEELLADMDEIDDPISGAEASLPSEEQTVASGTSEQDIPEPAEDYSEETAPVDPQVELPAEVLGEARPQIDAVFVTDQEPVEFSLSADKAEQLRIPADSFVPGLETPADRDDTALNAQDDAVSGEALVTPDLAEEGYLPVEGIASETAEDIAEQQKMEASLHALPSLKEGDLVLDADDETPRTEAESEEPKPVEPVKAVGDKSTAVPVASPLDAARQANARAEQMTEDAKPRQKQSPLDAIAAGRMGGKGNVTSLGGGAAFARPAGRERTLSDDDVELLLDLGYENTLSQKVGTQRVEQIKHRRQDEVKDPYRREGLYGYGGEEYTGHSQDDEIRETYRKHRRAAKLRRGFAVLMMLLVAAADLFVVAREWIPYDLSFIPHTGIYGAVSMGLLLIEALICLPYLKRGCRSLLHLSPLPGAIPVLMLIATLAYGAVGLFDPVGNLIFNLPAAMALVLLATGECMRVKTEESAFEVVSSRSRKILLADMEPKKKKVVRDGHIVKIINDDADRPWRRVRQADQVEDYFHRMSDSGKRYRGLAPLIAASVLVSVALALIVLVLKDDLRLSAAAFLFSVLLTLPSSALISYSYSMLTTTRELAERGCTIVGDSAVGEYARPSLLLFDDTDMFRSKSSTEITIKGGGDTRKYIRYAKRLFRTLGGTLRHVTTSDMSEEMYEDRVEILKVMDEGVEACIDGKAHVLAGTSAFMVKNGIRVPSESAELLVRRHVESCILYLAFEGKLRLGYEIDYRISGRFEQMIAELAKNGTSVAIETCDPDIHAEFLSRSRGPEMSPVRVIKPVRFERSVDVGAVSSGVVATRSARDIARATDACRRLAKNDRFIGALQWIMLLVGCAVAAVLTLTEVSLQGMLLTPVILPLVWCIPCLLSARKNMKYEQDQESENDNRN